MIDDPKQLALPSAPPNYLPLQIMIGVAMMTTFVWLTALFMLAMVAGFRPLVVYGLWLLPALPVACGALAFSALHRKRLRQAFFWSVLPFIQLAAGALWMFS